MLARFADFDAGTRGELTECVGGRAGHAGDVVKGKDAAAVCELFDGMPPARERAELGRSGIEQRSDHAGKGGLATLGRPLHAH